MRPRSLVRAAAAVVSSLALTGGLAASATASTHKSVARAHASAKNPYPKSLHGTFAFYSGGDTNVEQLWQDVLIPSFNRAYPNVHVNYVFDEHGQNDVTTLARVAQAVKNHTSSGYALLESATNAVELAARQGLFLPVTTKAVPNSANVPAASMKVVSYDAVPYRGSKVVLAYNSATVKNPPKTLSQLLTWIQQHPGKFAYCSPSGGGSGSYFVQSVLNANMPASVAEKLAFTNDPSLESYWSKGFAVLHKLNQYMYGAGNYPAGNTQVLSLLASGAIQMGTVWSDQGTQGLRSGQLPKSTKLTDIAPPFAGSPVYLGIPKYTPKNQALLAQAFLNFVLSVPQQAKVVQRLAGFPGVSVSVMTDTVKGEFGALGNLESLPYAAQISSDLNRLWQQQVP